MGRIFDGLKVIDCASFIAAPAAATILSDFGADVIKIEPPGTGDAYRETWKGAVHPTCSENFPWILDARNKRSLAIDLARGEGRDVLARLVTQADVFITNYPAAVRAKLGVRYDDLAPLNERLIYASFSGYGERGAEAAKPGFDTTAWWARSGLMGTVRSNAQTPPARSVGGMGDHPSSLALYAGIVMALYKRQLTGKGTEVSSSLLANGVWANGFMAQAALCGATFHDRPPREQALNAFANHYQCRDGLWLVFSIHDEDRQWPELARALDRPDFLTDPRFATKADRLANVEALIAAFDGEFIKRDREEWQSRLNARRIIFDIVAVPSDIPGDQQMRENDVVIPFADSPMLTINSPMALRDETKVQPRLPPELGQHSDEILRELGLANEEVARLRTAGIVG